MNETVKLNQTIWENVLRKIKEKVEPAIFEAWFDKTSLLKIENNKAVIETPMPIQKKQLKEMYNDLITSIFNEVTESNFILEYLTSDEITSNIVVDTGNIGMPVVIKENNLNKDYTFDTFIQGKSNQYAKMNAVAVAQKPGELYNPFFIYGPSGVGKTHMMHAIGNYIVDHSNKSVLYVTSEKFVSDFMIACSYKTADSKNDIDFINQFKNKYRDVDVLIIDDIQYLETAKQSQKEFFNTFNDLKDMGKQIIISSDRSPNDLKKLEENLRTRFNWGLSVDINPPDFDLSVKIINNLIKSENFIEFPDDVIDYIASFCKSSVRDLHGTVRRVMTFAACVNEPEITLDVVKEALYNYIKPNIISKNEIEKVQQIVAMKYNIKIDDLKGKSRKLNIAMPRHIAMYICREYLNDSFSKIGNEFGGKDHTTVMNAVTKISKEIKKNKSLLNEIEKIVNQIK